MQYAVKWLTKDKYLANICCCNNLQHAKSANINLSRSVFRFYTLHLFNKGRYVLFLCFVEGLAPVLNSVLVTSMLGLSYNCHWILYQYKPCFFTSSY